MAVVKSSPYRLELANAYRKLVFLHECGWPLISVLTLDGMTVACFKLDRFFEIEIYGDFLFVGKAMLSISVAERNAIKSWLADQP